MSDVEQLGGTAGGDQPGSPLYGDRLEILRFGMFRTSKADASCLCGGDPLRLPLQDQGPFIFR